MTNVTTFEVVEGAVALVGNNATEKMLALVKQGSAEFIASVVNAKGKVGAAAREAIAQSGDNAIVAAAAKANYRPFAEKLASILQKAVTISSRASFESYPDRISEMIAEAQAKKGAGIGKNGQPTPAMKRLMDAKAYAEDVIAKVAAIHAERLAAKAASEAVAAIEE